MFNGVPADLFHQFLSSSRTPLPLSFPSFDSFPPPQLHPLHHQKYEEKQEIRLVSADLEIESERSVPEPVDPWSTDEVLALFKIRSSMENRFSEFTWEHVSRKLAELGFKRSAEKCKEKFKEESNITYGKNNRLLSELEELYQGHDPAAEKNQNLENPSTTDHKVDENMQLEVNSKNEETVGNKSKDNSEKMILKKSKSKKRKRQQTFEMLMGFCEEMVKKMMAQQEEMHNKLVEKMVKRDEEKVAREEAWRKQEMDMINMELEIRAHEQAIAGDRQTNIIELLKKFTSKAPNILGHENSSSLPNPIALAIKNPSASLDPDISKPPSNTLASQNPTSLISAQNNPLASTSLSIQKLPKNSNSLMIKSTQKNPLPPTSLSTQKLPQKPTHNYVNDKEYLGRRWPRDEVLALINLRCNLQSSGDHQDKESAAKGPLWETISQGMLELGYKRNAKRCKEKWENINKYFRKTKDVNKKRSLDSRTCPYFHQLSALYDQGTLLVPYEGPENCSASPENFPDLPEKCPGSSQGGFIASDSTMQVVDHGDKNMVQVPSFDFEF